MNLYNSGVLRLRLHTQPSSSPGSLPLQGGGMTAQSEGGSGTSPMAWLSIEFPADAVAMAFDFAVEGNPVDDVLVCGIEAQNLFSLEAKYIPLDEMSASPLIDVSAWAGTTTELFFGFLGGTSTDAALIIENIRFYSLEEPRLDIALSGESVLLIYPATAGGYVVETASALVGWEWEAVINAPTILDDRYVFDFPWSDETRFFRLRAR